jgi:hypothetical protein
MNPSSFARVQNFGTSGFKQAQQIFYQNYIGSGEDSAEAGNFRQFKRWESNWGPRLTGSNNFDTAFGCYNFFVHNFNQVDTKNLAVVSGWEELGPMKNGQGGIGRIDAIAFHPTDTNTIYVGCPSGGVWASYNGGQNWQNLNTDFQLPGLGVSSVAVDPENPNNIFLGTGDADSEYVFSSGIYRSADAGQNWEEAGLNNLNVHFTIAKVLLHPTNNDVAFAATSLGIYQTSNRNSPAPEWLKVYPAGPDTFEYIKNIVFHPDNPGQLFATGIDIISSYQSGAVGTWFRIAIAQTGLDFENTPWPNVFNGEEYVVSLNMAMAQQGDFLYVNCVSRDGPPPYNWQSATHYHIFRYDITTGLWNTLSKANLHGAITPGRTEMVVSPLNSKVLYCAGVKIKVLDLSNTKNPWEKVDFDSHIDFHELMFSPWDENMLFAGTDGGLYKKNLTPTSHFIDNGDGSDGGFYRKDYTGMTNGYPTIELNEGLGIATIYNFASSPVDPYQILTGAQDCGINYFKDNIWRIQENPSDGFQCLMDNTDIDLMYTTIFHPTNGSLYRSAFDCHDPHWQSFFNGQSPVNEQSWFGASLVADPLNFKTLFQARINLWKVDDASTATLYDWYKISDVSSLTSNLWGADNCVIFALEIAPSNPDYIYFTGIKVDSWVTDFDANRVFKTSTGGGTNANDWTEITPPTPGNQSGTYFVTDIAVSSQDPNKIWITYSGYLENYKVKYFDGNGWIDYNEGLPNIPVNCIVYVNGSNDLLFVGTDNGVYYREEGAQQWQPFMTNLPHVKVNWLELNYTNQKLRAGTFGRGMWETDIPASAINAITSRPAPGVNKLSASSEYPENQNLIHLAAFPNPGKDGKLILKLKNKNNLSDMELRCYNSFGSEMLRQIIDNEQEGVELSVAAWPKGVYVAIVYNDGGAVGSCKILVAR